MTRMAPLQKIAEIVARDSALFRTRDLPPDAAAAKRHNERLNAEILRVLSTKRRGAKAGRPRKAQMDEGTTRAPVCVYRRKGVSRLCRLSSGKDRMFDDENMFCT